MKTLFDLRYKDFVNLIENELQIKNWFIRDETIFARTNSISTTKKFQYLKNRAEQMKYEFDDTEIVSWLDSLVILYYALDKVKDHELKNSIHILQEYCIPYSKKRADYLLVYNNKILILEFSFNKLGYEFNYEKKLQQAIGYKELLCNILPKEIDIGTHTFIIEPEEDENRKTIYIDRDEHLPNHYKIIELAKIIKFFFHKDSKRAITTLMQIEE